MTGYFGSSATFGSRYLSVMGSTDCFVTHVTGQGVVDWAIRLGGTSSDRCYGIANDRGQGFLVTGRFEGSAELGPDVLSTHGSGDIFAVGGNTDGTFRWAMRAGGTSDDQGRCIASDGTGGAYIGGYFGGTAWFGPTTMSTLGSNDGFIMRVSGSGDLVWAARTGGTSDDKAYGIASTDVGLSLIHI